MISSGLFFFLQWSFDRGFLDYVRRQGLQHAEKLSEKLIHLYSTTGSWEFIRNNELYWIRLNAEAFLSANPKEKIFDEPDFPKTEPRHESARGDYPEDRGMQIWRGDPHPGMEAGMSGPGDFRPPPGEYRHMGPPIRLYDSKGNWVVGADPEKPKPKIMKPLTLEGKTIGYLGLVPAQEIVDPGDLLFVQEQTELFGMVTLGMLVISVLLTFPVTIHLLRPIQHLTAGTLQLINGLFTTRIPVITRDELGVLSKNFNTLAITLEKNETSRRQWVADISHELRTPIAVLRGEIEAIQDGVRKPEPAVIGTLQGEIIHLERLVNDLYELSMSDIGALKYRMISVAPGNILEESVDVFEKRFRDKGLEIVIRSLPDSTEVIQGDPDRLHQLFTNLLENSLRYTDSPGYLYIDVGVNSNFLDFRFSDSAPGVSPDELPRLFERFFRVDPSRSRSGGGLGLAMCKNIIEAHQGEITCELSAYGGLEVLIRLPRGI